jgi:outer membrane protein OmpA-like peptidoglycan-associated protein
VAVVTPMPPRHERGAVDEGPDRQLLAGLLLEVARSINRDVASTHPSQLGADPRLEALRHILLEREQATLRRLQRKLDDPEEFAAAVSAVLTQALDRASSRDDRLGQVLAPTVERAAQTSIRKDPRTLVNILYPLMGPAIRKSIAETLDGTVQSLNQALKHSLSLRGLKWRWEAIRTGTSFAEVVLKHTLVYRVEHVFLIHRGTGLLIEHVTAEQAVAKDPQLVSSMLSAIQDFVRDSFDDSGGSGIDTLRLGEFVLWCEQGPLAFLAAVIRGNPPESLHEVLRATLAAIHDDKRAALEAFDGDTTPFADLRERLEACLRQQEQPRDRSASPLLWLAPLALLAIAGYWLVQRHQENARFEAYVQRLQSEPGIVVTGFERRAGKWHISGLRDPLAADPAALLSEAKLGDTDVIGRWDLYQALDSAIALKRLEAALHPPPTVTFELADNTIRATGTASHQWVEKARALSQLMPLGSARVDLSAVGNVDLTALERLRDAIQARTIYFEHNVALPAPGQEESIDALAGALKQLTETGAQLQVSVRVTLIGHADRTGKDALNLALSLGRAEAVRSLLRARGVDPNVLAVRGAGPLEPLHSETSESDRSLNRRVSFSIAIHN